MITLEKTYFCTFAFAPLNINLAPLLNTKMVKMMTLFTLTPIIKE